MDLHVFLNNFSLKLTVQSLKTPKRFVENELNSISITWYPLTVLRAMLIMAYPKYHSLNAYKLPKRASTTF